MKSALVVLVLKILTVSEIVRSYEYIEIPVNTCCQYQGQYVNGSCNTYEKDDLQIQSLKGFPNYYLKSYHKSDGVRIFK